MTTVAQLVDRSPISRRVRTIRDSWSPSERKERAQEGRRRREALARMLFSQPNDSQEVWAAGAPSPVDIRRIAG